MTVDEIQSLLKRLTGAERDGDVGTLDALTTSDFTLVGPLGFVLPKSEWLDRYRSGALTTDVLTWQQDTARRYDQTAIVVGTHDQHARYQGHAVDGRFRATHVLIRHNTQWRLASTHLSPIGEPPAFARPAPFAPPTA